MMILRVWKGSNTQASQGHKNSIVAGRACESTRHSTRSFLDLPPEIRNNIYGHVATSTVILYTAGTTPTNLSRLGFAATCRQIYREFRLLLLANATVRVHVRDYRLDLLTQVFTLQDPDACEALRLNKSTFVILHISHVLTPNERARLQRWNEYLSDFPPSLFESFQFIPWIGQNIRPPRPQKRYADQQDMQLDLLRSHNRILADLHQESCARTGAINSIALETLMRQMHSDYLARKSRSTE